MAVIINFVGAESSTTAKKKKKKSKELSEISDQWQEAKGASKGRSVYNPVNPNQMVEGGGMAYRGIQLWGHYDAVQRIQTSLDIVWQDSHARETVQRYVNKIMCVQLNGSYGWSYYELEFQGIIAIDPYSQDMVGRAGTIYHEALEHVERNHSKIEKMQQQFIRRVS